MTEGIAGRRILIVEDDAFIADSLRDCLESVGAVVVGPVASVAAAIAVVEGADPLDGAAVDVNLNGERAFSVADALAARGVPFVLMTGYGAESIPARYAEVPRCGKPFDLAELVRLLSG